MWPHKPGRRESGPVATAGKAGSCDNKMPSYNGDPAQSIPRTQTPIHPGTHPSSSTTAPTTGTRKAPGGHSHQREPWRNHRLSIGSSSPHRCMTLGLAGACTCVSTSYRVRAALKHQLRGAKCSVILNVEEGRLLQREKPPLSNGQSFWLQMGPEATAHPAASPPTQDPRH